MTHDPCSVCDYSLIGGKAMTQKERIIEFCDRHGGITTVDAFKMGITQLGTRIFELKEKGYDFKTPRVKGTRLVKYTITKRPDLTLF